MAEINELDDSFDYGDDNDNTADNDDKVDAELAGIQARAREMEEETAKLKQLQVDIELLSRGALSTPRSPIEDASDSDPRSIYIGNVDYGATADELERHFVGCGTVNRVTILANKLTGHPKGFAYMEFAELDSATVALAMDESLFRGRAIKVSAKRTNRPGIYTATNRPPRGQFGTPRRGRGYGYRPRGGYGPVRRPRARYAVWAPY